MNSEMRTGVTGLVVFVIGVIAFGLAYTATHSEIIGLIAGGAVLVAWYFYRESVKPKQP